jgi:hypothetical protein
MNELIVMMMFGLLMMIVLILIKVWDDLGGR